MESLSFKRILKILSASRIKLNVAETACVSNELVECTVYTDASGTVCRSTQPKKGPLNYRALLQQYNDEHKLQKKVHRVPKTVCMIQYRFGTLQCTSSTLREVMSKKNSLSSVSLVQPSVPGIVRY